MSVCQFSTNLSISYISLTCLCQVYLRSVAGLSQVCRRCLQALLITSKYRHSLKCFVLFFNQQTNPAVTGMLVWLGDDT